MPLRWQILMPAISLLLIGVVWQLIRRNKLRTRYAMLWLVTSSIFFLLTLFRGIPRAFADFFEVTYAPSLYFAVAIVLILALLLNQAIVLSGLSRQARELAERYALLEWRIEKREGERPPEHPRP